MQKKLKQYGAKPMAEFTVGEVIDGDTFKVKNGWKWENKTGNTVRPTGYNTPEKGEPGYGRSQAEKKGGLL